ncbi:hypothetical protein BGW36DRAFT_387425, partial [Talaromyces proteolyticus]
MVGVPRNKGCRNCISKRLKCDLTHPQCQRCIETGVRCPGYARVFKFQNEGPALQQRYMRGGGEPSSARTRSSKKGQQEKEIGSERSGERRRYKGQGVPSEKNMCRALYKPFNLTIDESVSPSLAVQTVSAQQVQVFINYILTAWPCLFKCTETRVPVTWVEYAVQRGSGSPYNAFDLSMRATTCIYMGAQYGDMRLLNAGRQLYGRSLRMLAASLSDIESGTSDEVLAAAVVLSCYEMYAGATEKSWLYHHAGVIEMMRLRGAKAHTDGFGRAIYIAYRGFFITAALLTGEACLLEQPEWQTMSEFIAADNAKQPDSSLFTDIAERAFREMVRVPGFVKRVKDLWEAPPEKQILLGPQLLQELVRLRAALRGLHTEFGITVATHGGPDNKDATFANDRRREFVGPIPYVFFDGFSSLAIRGMRSGIILVDELLILLTPDPHNRDILREEVNIFSQVDDINSSTGELTQSQKQAAGLLPSNSLYSLSGGGGGSGAVSASKFPFFLFPLNPSN